MRFGSLFSGIGGFDLGLERAGMSGAWQVELDDKARAVSRHHWPDMEQHADVREVGRSTLAPVDLIAGGFPCQDLSVAGRRAGLAGERSGLFHEFMRVAAELAPRWVLIENVGGLLSSNGGRDMGTVLGTLGRLGYWWTYRCLDSQHFRVPQRRYRVFVVGHLGGPCPPEVLLEPEGLPGHLAARREAREGVAATLTRGATSGGRGGYAGRRREDDVNLVAFNLRGRDGGAMPEMSDAASLRSASGGSSRSYVAHTLSTCHGATEDGTGRGTPLVAMPLRAGRQYSDMGDGTANVIAALAFNCTQDPISGEVAGALSDQGAAVSLAAGVRRLTPRECERLQGFPDDWTRYGGGREMADGPRYRMLGNAVTVPVAEWIGRRIAALSAEGAA